jgi:hypothetical protein
MTSKQILFSRSEACQEGPQSHARAFGGGVVTSDSTVASHSGLSIHSCSSYQGSLRAGSRAPAKDHPLLIWNIRPNQPPDFEHIYKIS